MKHKFTLLLLVAALAVPTIQAQYKTRANVAPSARPVAVKKVKANVDVPEGFASVTLTAGDVWGDGTGYQMLLDADHNTYGTVIPTTGGLTASGDATDEVYAEFEYKIPENADGSLSTANIVFESSATILIPAGTYDYCITNPSPDDRVWIASDGGDVPGRGDDFVFESGNSYEFTLGIYGTNDGVALTVVSPLDPTIPEDVTVTPQTDAADVAWTPGENNESFNLRYREYIDPALLNPFWDFEDESQLEGWKIYDNDGDGYNWGYGGGSVGGDESTATQVLTSSSWISTAGALTPDNWLISPEVKLGGNVQFEAWGQDPNYAAEHFAVYVYQGTWDGSNGIDGFVQISDEIVATATNVVYQYDLSAYEGNGHIAIRHFNVTDEFRLNIDNVKVTVPGGIDKPEWIEVNDIEAPLYTINELTPETEYEVQVQAVGNNMTTAWTETVNFVTLPAEGTAIDEVKAETVAADAWYNLAGMKLNGQPTERGIYINNGKKVVIK